MIVKIKYIFAEFVVNAAADCSVGIMHFAVNHSECCFGVAVFADFNCLPLL